MSIHDKSHQTSSKREITAMAAEEWDKRGPSFLRFYEGAPELTKIRLAHEEGFIAGLCASSATLPPRDELTNAKLDAIGFCLMGPAWPDRYRGLLPVATTDGKDHA